MNQIPRRAGLAWSHRRRLRPFGVVPAAFAFAVALALAGWVSVVSGELRAAQIDWSSAAFADNFTSAGGMARLDGSFIFELGAFEPGFVPAAENVSEWAGKWRVLDRTAYNATTRFFASSALLESNTGAFATGRQAYIWGYGGTAAREWILISSSGWKWPAAGGLALPATWAVGEADAAGILVGAVNGAGFHMMTERVASGSPPALSGEAWRTLYFSKEQRSDAAVSGWDADPDRDGRGNALEFALGALPLEPSPANAPEILITTDETGSSLTLSVSKLANRAVRYRAEASSDLRAWRSDAQAVETLEDSPEALRARAGAPVNPGSPNFIRLRVEVIE